MARKYCKECGQLIYHQITAKRQWAPHNDDVAYCSTCPPPQVIAEGMAAAREKRRADMAGKPGKVQHGPARFLYRAQSNGCRRKPAASDVAKI